VPMPPQTGHGEFKSVYNKDIGLEFVALVPKYEIIKFDQQFFLFHGHTPKRIGALSTLLNYDTIHQKSRKIIHICLRKHD
jgi:hypothetical protein